MNDNQYFLKPSFNSKIRFPLSVFFIQTAVIFLFAFLSLSFGGDKKITEYSLFAESNIPQGICIDKNNNVYVSSVDPNNPFQNLITKYSREGNKLKENIVNLFGYLEYDPVTNKIWLLDNQQFYLVDPADLTISSYLDISEHNADVDNIYDMATDSKFPMYINAGGAKYQDFDLYRNGNRLDVFVAGFHQAWQFILRIRIINETVQSAKVVIASGSSLSPEDSSPHGVAVNSNGVVLTTLGWTGKVTNVDRGVVFSADFPEDQSQPIFLFDEYQTFGSRGMTCDNNDNFYVATGWCGSGVAGGGESSIIFIPASLAKTYSYAFQSLYANPRDIVFNPGNQKFYISDSDTDFFKDEDAIWEMSDIAIKVKGKYIFPDKFALLQNYPNPFNPATTIRYSIAYSSNVTLKIFDVLGKEITTLISGNKLPGNYSIKFNCSNLSAGIYFYRLQAGKFSATKKFVILK